MLRQPVLLLVFFDLFLACADEHNHGHMDTHAKEDHRHHDDGHHHHDNQHHDDEGTHESDHQHHHAHGSEDRNLERTQKEEPISFRNAYLSAGFMSVVSFVGVVFAIVLDIPKVGPVVQLCCLQFAGVTLAADAFLHLLPHALEGASHGEMNAVGLSASAGCLSLLALPHLLHHQHGDQEGHVQAYGIANLVSELLHNFVDGLTIGFSAYAGVASCLSTSLAVFVHELPQEIGDFMVLRAAGFKNASLLFWNFIVSLSCLGGVACVHLLGQQVMEPLQRYLMAFTAGSFLTLSLNMIFPQVVETISKNYEGRMATYAKLLCVAMTFAALYVLLRIGDLEDHGGHDHHHEHSGHGHGSHVLPSHEL